jgi:hypothetical protein
MVRRERFPSTMHPPPLQNLAASSRLHGRKCVALAIAGLLTGLCGLRAQGQIPAAGLGNASDRSCSIPGLATHSHSMIQDAALVIAYTSQASLARSLEVTLIAHGEAGPEYKARSEESRPSPVMIEFRAPAFLRMTGVIPFSAQRAFDMSSDGRNFRLLVPDGKVMRFIVGPVDAPATSSNPRENLRPQPVIDALHWPIGKLRTGTGKGQAIEKGIREITLDLAPSSQAGERTAIVQFDVVHGVVTQLTEDDAAERTVTSIQYSDWQRIARESGGSDLSCFPKRIVVVQPRQDLRLEMKIISVTLNPPISPDKFRLMPPRGVVVTRLSPPPPSRDH